MLTRAVSDDDEDTEGTSKIFYSLSLSGTGGASRGTTIAHTKGLGKSNIASFGQQSDTKTLFGSQEFVLISEVDISDANKCLTVLAILGSPVETGILGPIEVTNITNFVTSYTFLDSLEEILLIDLNRDQGLNFHSYELVR